MLGPSHVHLAVCLANCKCRRCTSVPSGRGRVDPHPQPCFLPAAAPVSACELLSWPAHTRCWFCGQCFCILLHFFSLGQFCRGTLQPVCLLSLFLSATGPLVIYPSLHEGGWKNMNPRLGVSWSEKRLEKVFETKAQALIGEVGHRL